MLNNRDEFDPSDLESSINALESKVDAIEEDVTQLDTDVTTNENSIVATDTAVSGLDTRVTALELAPAPSSGDGFFATTAVYNVVASGIPNWAQFGRNLDYFIGTFGGYTEQFAYGRQLVQNNTMQILITGIYMLTVVMTLTTDSNETMALTVGTGLPATRFSGFPMHLFTIGTLPETYTLTGMLDVQVPDSRFSVDLYSTTAFTADMDIRLSLVRLGDT